MSKINKLIIPILILPATGYSIEMAGWQLSRQNSETPSNATIQLYSVASTGLLKGISIAHGYDLKCPDTLVIQADDEKKVGPSLFNPYTTASLDTKASSGSYIISGYSGWDTPSTHTCHLEWTREVADQIQDVVISGKGFSISIQGVEEKISSSNTETFNMVKSPPSDCPILIDLDGDGFFLGEKGVGVNFDVRGHGTKNLIQWVRPNEDDAFLALDLNHNWKIDDGTELFGQGTVLLNSQNHLAPNGFLALAQYDSELLGGNEDGIIDESDDIWHSLLIWLDKNADGISQSSEVSKISEYDIHFLETIPRIRDVVDGSGNYIPLWGVAGRLSHDVLTTIEIVDVFFMQLDIE